MLNNKHIQIDNAYLKLKVWVKPNASKQAIIGQNEHGWIVAVHAAPQEGLANKAILELLAKSFKIAKSQIQLINGFKSRVKTFLIPRSKQTEQQAIQIINTFFQQ